MEESRENKWVKMKAAGIEAGSPAAKRFKADNPVTDEAIKDTAFAWYLIS